MAHRLILKLLFYVVARCPGTLLRHRERLAGLCWRLSPHLRGVFAANGRGVLGPDASDAQIADYGRGVVAEFIRFIADIAQSRDRSLDEIVQRIATIHGNEHFLEAINLQRGLIIATCHAGNFEVGAAAVAKRVAETHVLFQGDAQGGFEQMRSRLHQRLGVTEAHVEEGLGAWMQLRDALSRGGAVLIQADRCMPGQKGTATPFLHGQVEMPEGPAKLARLSGAPILPIVSVIEDDGRVRLIVDAMIDPQSCPGRSLQDTARKRLASFFSEVIRNHPTQWHTLHHAFIQNRP